MRAVFHPEARLEYLEAIAFYEHTRPGLGGRFADEVEAALRAILNASMRWPRLDGDVRQYQVHTFPYSLLFAVDHHRLLVLAVMHMSRRPGYWRSRTLHEPRDIAQPPTSA